MPPSRRPARRVGKGMSVPLSEEEQRILQEMEQKLREHDREFVERVNHSSHRLHTPKGARWSAAGFLVGTVLLLSTFRSTLALAFFGVLVMVVCALAFAQSLAAAREPGAGGERREPRAARAAGRGGLADEWSEMRRRMRSRFGHRG